MVNSVWEPGKGEVWYRETAHSKDPGGVLIIQLGKSMETLGSWDRKNWMGGRGKTETKSQYIYRNFLTRKAQYYSGCSALGGSKLWHWECSSRGWVLATCQEYSSLPQSRLQITWEFCLNADSDSAGLGGTWESSLLRSSLTMPMLLIDRSHSAVWKEIIMRQMNLVRESQRVTQTRLHKMGAL